MPQITILPENRIWEVATGETLHDALARLGVLDAPCGGQGKCGKCKVLVNGEEKLACQTYVNQDVTVTLPARAEIQGQPATCKAAAFDIGTTTLVCYGMDERGRVVSQSATRNPQVSFGADVISRIRAALSGHGEAMTQTVRRSMSALLEAVCTDPQQIETVTVVGNPTMGQLFLGIPLDNLAKIPFAPVRTRVQRLPGKAYLPICPRATLICLPDISGFVGADTLGCILAEKLYQRKELTLLVDIGTNGELVLGNCHGMTACATAAGPALEGANIRFGMRAQNGAIDRVWLENGKLRCHVIGGGEAEGICGSGLVDALAAIMDLGYVNQRGKILRKASPCTGGSWRPAAQEAPPAWGDFCAQQPEENIWISDRVCLTQEDIRQLQLAKGAIRAGIQMLCAHRGVKLSDIQKVCLAGAFGSSLSPESACRIGLLPEEWLEKIQTVGNAAGAGAVLAADPGAQALAEEIAGNTEFLELASLPDFPRTFARAMALKQDWVRVAKTCGFSHAAVFDPAILVAREDVRAMCAADKCHAYGKNWTCPPHCGSLSQCQERLQGYRHGILLQTVGQLAKPIDTRGYRETEQRHLTRFSRFCEVLRKTHPNALCLGSGGCRVCKTCAWPEACRFPGQAVSSMEGYGLFVTQVCRDVGLDYYYGEKTIAYTACVLF